MERLIRPPAKPTVQVKRPTGRSVHLRAFEGRLSASVIVVEFVRAKDGRPGPRPIKIDSVPALWFGPAPGALHSTRLSAGIRRLCGGNAIAASKKAWFAAHRSGCRHARPYRIWTSKFSNAIDFPHSSLMRQLY